MDRKRIEGSIRKDQVPGIGNRIVEGVEPFLAAVGLILVLELGDKTQLATISLATRHPWAPVFAGAVAGLVAITAIGAAFGALLAATLADRTMEIKIGGGLLFIAFGVASYFRKEEPREDHGSRSAFASAFSLNFLAELGDKTQLAVVVLAAANAAPLSVFLGGSLGLAMVSAMSVAIGTGLAKFLRATWLRLLSTLLFIAAGVLLIGEALLGG